MNKPTLLSEIRDLIAKDKLSAALQQTQILLANSPLLDEAIQQSARFQNIRRQIRLGTVSHENATLTRNQIRTGLLDLLREIDVQSKQPAIRHEIEKSITNNKNVVTGNIQAGGDVRIGDKTTTQNADKIYNIDHIDNANFS